MLTKVLANPKNILLKSGAIVINMRQGLFLERSLKKEFENFCSLIEELLWWQNSQILDISLYVGISQLDLQELGFARY